MYNSVSVLNTPVGNITNIDIFVLLPMKLLTRLIEFLVLKEQLVPVFSDVQVVFLKIAQILEFILYFIEVFVIIGL